MKHWRAGYEKLYPTESETLLSHQGKLYELRKTADTFSRQLTHIETTGASEEYLNERLLKAAGYFQPPFEQMRDFCNDIAVLEIDNKETKKNAKEAWTELMILLDILCGAFGLISAGEFTPEAFGKIRTEYQLQERKTVKKKSTKSAVASKVNTPQEQLVVNEELRDELLRWRTARFKKENVSAYTIMHQSTLLEIAARIPQNSMELLAIKGFGKAKLEKFGAEILEITLKYKKDTTQPCIF